MSELAFKMATSNATLTSIWIDEASGSPIKPVTPSRSSTASSTELKDDVLRFYKHSGLEPMAKDAGILDANGDFQSFITDQKGIQMIALPIQPSPIKIEPATIAPKQQQTIYGTPQRVVNPTHVLAQTPTRQQQVGKSPQPWLTAGRKRSIDMQEDYTEGLNRGFANKVTPGRGHKGLRHFSTKVCEKVEKKGITTYGEVADELVRELNDPLFVSDQQQSAQGEMILEYDQKNIRRRVYDALNVLMAMNIISKEKKEIKWIGLPTNSAQEVHNLEVEKRRREERIKHKTHQLQELILQQIAFKNLVNRNRDHERVHGKPTTNSAIQLPYIIVNTSKKTVIDCSISNDKYEYLFNFDNTFEIHDDIEVLKRMGMAFGLEKNQCSNEDAQKALKMVPKALEPYVLELANPSATSAGPSSLGIARPSVSSDSADASISLSRQSSIESFMPDDQYSDDSDSGRSSPADITIGNSY